MNLGKNRGQLFSGDIAIATVVFLATISMVFFLWNTTNEDISRAESLRDMQKISSESIEQLIRTPGIPQDWAQDNVRVPGLATEDRHINISKAAYFIELMNSTNYADNKGLLGLGAYDFYMNVTDIDGNLVTVGGVNFTAGQLPLGELEKLNNLRTAILNETIVRFNFIIWR